MKLIGRPIEKQHRDIFPLCTVYEIRNIYLNVKVEKNEKKYNNYDENQKIRTKHFGVRKERWPKSHPQMSGRK